MNWRVNMFTAKKLSNILCLVALCFILGVPAMAKGNVSNDFSVSYKSDSRLAEDVAHAIRMYPWYDVFDWVEGTVHNGVVTLTGEVREPFHKDDYGKMIARIPGVQRVDNELRVLPLSTFDDQIRWAAASTIYRD